MKWLCLILFAVGALIIGTGTVAQLRARSPEDRGGAGIVIGIGICVEAIDAAIFIVWKLLT